MAMQKKGRDSVMDIITCIPFRESTNDPEHQQNIYPQYWVTHFLILHSIFFSLFVSNTFSCFSCHHDTRNRLGSKLEKIKKSPFKGFFQKMGNKLSCSCGPLKIKGYRFDDPWAANTRTRRNGHLLRSVIALTEI